MSSFRIAAVVACRVLGLYIAMQWISYLPMRWFFELLQASPFRWSLLSGALMVVVPVALAVILWKLAPWIAKHMLADVESESASPAAITMEEVQVVAVSILGLLLITIALPGVVVVVLEYFRIPELISDESVQFSAQASAIKVMVLNVMKLALGVWLFLGAHSFVRFMQRFCPPSCTSEP